MSESPLKEMPYASRDDVPPEIIEAGISAISEWYPDWLNRTDPIIANRVIAEIYVAMDQARFKFRTDSPAHLAHRPFQKASRSSLLS